MTHRVNAAVFRIGKNLNWHSLGSPLFRWRDLKVSLFLNYFLSRFLEKESYVLVRYGLRSEFKFLKIAIIAFRITSIRADREFFSLYNPYFETYWKKNKVFTGKFKKIGVFKKNVMALEDMSPMYEDGVGNCYINPLRRRGKPSISFVKNWDRVLMFFVEGSFSPQNYEREVVDSGVIGYNIYYYIRLVSRLMAIRYAIRKSVMRVLRRRVLPQLPRVFKSKFMDFSYEFLERYFCSAPISSLRCKSFLFSFLVSTVKKIKNKRLLLQKCFFSMSLKFLRRIVLWGAALKIKKKRVLRSKKIFLNLKKKYFLFKRGCKKWVRYSKVFLSSKRRFFRRGCYKPSKFFRRLEIKNKSFKPFFTYKNLRKSKNTFKRGFLNLKNFIFMKMNRSNHLKDVFSPLFRSLASLICFFKPWSLRCFKKINFLFGSIFEKFFFLKSFYLYKELGNTVLKAFPYSFLDLKKKKLFKSVPRGVYINDLLKVKKKFLFFINFFKLKYFKFKKVSVNVKSYGKFNFFYHFFLMNFAIFKFYRLKFKPDSVKHLYRKKKLFFILEKKLSSILKTRVMLKFFNPLCCNSMDDLWARSLFNTLSDVSNMYMRNRLDFKPSFILALYTMLAFKYNSPAFLGDYVANQLEWRWRKRSHGAFMRILIFFFKNLRFDTMYTKNLLNFSIGFYGKVWGKLRAGKLVIRGASGYALPFHRASLKVDTSFTWAESQFGTFGIRIWIGRN